MNSNKKEISKGNSHPFRVPLLTLKIITDGFEKNQKNETAWELVADAFGRLELASESAAQPWRRDLQVFNPVLVLYSIVGEKQLRLSPTPCRIGHNLRDLLRYDTNLLAHPEEYTDLFSQLLESWIKGTKQNPDAFVRIHGTVHKEILEIRISSRSTPASSEAEQKATSQLLKKWGGEMHFTQENPERTVQIIRLPLF